MNGVSKVLGFLALPVILGAGSVLFGLGIIADSSLSGLEAFFTSSLAGSWAVVFGMAIALPVFLSQWIKPWVALLIYAVFAIALYFPIAIFASSATPCFMLAGMYALMGFACCIGLTEKVAPAGIVALNWPVPVWVVLALAIDLALNFLFFTNRSLEHVYLTLAGFVGGIVVGAIYSVVTRVPGSVGSSLASPAHREEVRRVHEQVATAPVGERPKISVLDMKMAAVVNEDQAEDQGNVTTAKIFVENQDG